MQQGWKDGKKLQSQKYAIFKLKADLLLGDLNLV